MTARSSLLQGPPRPAEQAGDQVAWLRGEIRLYARDLAMLTMLQGLDPDVARDRLGLACDGFANAIAAQDDVRQAAIQAESDVAAAVLRRLVDQLHRRVFSLGREHAPGLEIVAAAERVCEQHGVFVPSDLLLDRVRAIAHRAAAPRRRRYAA